VSAVIDAIETKKFGGELPDGLIRDVVEGYTAGEVPDYQMASLLMAIFIRGMDYGETLALTRAMAESGETYSFPECVDKHSTGGVGDKVSLTALPIVAACGAPVAKLSGRGLGTTGGTIDKLESIPGFSCHLSEEQFRRQVEEIGLDYSRGRGSRTGGQGDLRPPRHDGHGGLPAAHRKLDRLEKSRHGSRTPSLRREARLGGVHEGDR
jgi:thymidine phosphorylase